MLVNWRPRARVALWQIIDYISDQNPVAAFELYDDIEQAISALPQHPYLYRKGRVSDTREIVVHPNYIVVYCVTIDHIEILNILHARQHYPSNE